MTIVKNIILHFNLQANATQETLLILDAEIDEMIIIE